MTWNSALDRLHAAVLETFGEKSQADGGQGRPSVNGVEFDATFTRRYIEIPSGDTVHAGYFPLLECRAADAETVGLDVGTHPTVRGTLYTVVAAQPDGDGWVTFVLEEA